MLGDPSDRVVDVYGPAGHDGQGSDLVGFSSGGLSHTNWVGFRENLPERLDRLIGNSAWRQWSSPFPIASPAGMALTHALRHSDIWSAAACHSGDMGFELCYLPDMPAVLRALAGADNSIERWWQQLEAA